MHLLPPTATSSGCVLTPLRPGDIEVVAADMRPADREEAYAYCGHRRYLDLLRLTAARSREVITVCELDSGRTLAVMGVTTVSVLDRIGSVWAAGTPDVNRHMRTLTPIAHKYARRLLKEYQLLHNHVHVENRAAVRWLKAIGFTIHGAETFGPVGASFYPFTME